MTVDASHATGDVGALTVPVGDAIVIALEAAGVRHAFGVISLHNMPILDAIGRRGAIRFVTARGEAGAVSMADAAARVSGTLGVAVTSTGTGAGNAAGVLVEAQTAGTPLLHLTGQIDSPYLDRQWGFIHEAADQPGMLRAVSKAFFRIARPEDAVSIIKAAILTATTAPTGPVSVEIPIDVQRASVRVEAPLRLVAPAPLQPSAAALDGLAVLVTAAKRPLLWLGGGAREAAVPALRLAEMGIGVVTSATGRGIVPEDHPSSLGTFAAAPAVIELYKSCDLMIVVGSHLRSNETVTYKAALPSRIVRVDVDARAEGRGYPGIDFILGDAALVLGGLAARLQDYRTAAEFRSAVMAARRLAEEDLRRRVGPYAALIDAVGAALPRDGIWVRDITLSNSIWGNRAPVIRSPRGAVHAVGGGIGIGLPHAIGAAIGSGRRVIAMAGDGGLALSFSEFGTLAETGADIALIVMNDGGYGVIRNIQDAEYGSRRMYTDLLNPKFETLCAAFGLPYRKVAAADQFVPVLRAAIETRGPTVIEVDMKAVGGFGATFAGPPVKTEKA